MTIIVAIIILGILIIVHEFGHFLFAKWVGMEVERFSVGMGNVVVSKVWKGTEFAISAIPIGGYVKIKGMEIDKEGYEENEFFNLPVWKRLLVVLAGPFFNLILAFVVFFFVLSFYGDPVIPSVKVKYMENYFENQDSIIAIDGIQVNYFDDIYNALGKENVHTIDFIRNNKKYSISIEDSMLSKVSPLLMPIIGEIEKNGPAWNAGLRRGDMIVKIEEDTIKSWDDMVDIIHNSPGKKLHIFVKRNDNLFDVFVVPEKKKMMVDDSIKEVGLIGIGIYTKFRKYGFMYSIKEAYSRTLYSAGMIIYFLKSLFTGHVSVRDVGGPVAIVQMTGQSMRWGLLSLLNFVALLSVNLFVVNLLPFPPSDGGYVLFFTLEKFIGKKRGLKTLKIMQQVGFVILFGLFILITFNDIIRVLWG